MEANVLASLVTVGVADDEHLREVVVSLTCADKFVLEEALTRVRPAGSGVCLVLDRGDSGVLNGREYVRLVSVLCRWSLGREGRGEPCQCHDGDQFLHLRLVTIVMMDMDRSREDVMAYSRCPLFTQRYTFLADPKD